MTNQTEEVKKMPIEVLIASHVELSDNYLFFISPHDFLDLFCRGILTIDSEAGFKCGVMGVSDKRIHVYTQTSPLPDCLGSIRTALMLVRTKPTYGKLCTDYYLVTHQNSMFKHNFKECKVGVVPPLSKDVLRYFHEEVIITEGSLIGVGSSLEIALILHEEKMYSGIEQHSIVTDAIYQQESVPCCGDYTNIRRRTAAFASNGLLWEDPFEMIIDVFDITKDHISLTRKRYNFLDGGYESYISSVVMIQNKTNPNH